MCKKCIKVIEQVLKVKMDSTHSGAAILGALDHMPKCPAMKALEELTPSGSEFWEDPKRCYEYVREARSSQHKLLIETIGQRNALQGNIDNAVDDEISRDLGGEA